MINARSTSAFQSFVGLALWLVASGPAGAASLAPSLYVARVLAWDKFGTSEAHLAIARGNSDRVKALARLSARDHARSAAMIRAAVRGAVNHDPAPPALDPEQARLLSILRVTPMRRLDEAYVAQQVQAQAAALALHDAYAAQGGVPELRLAAQLLAPVVRQNLNAVRELQQRLGRVHGDTARAPVAERR